MNEIEKKARERAEELAQRYYIKTGFTADQNFMIEIITAALLDFRKEGRKEAKEEVAGKLCWGCSSEIRRDGMNHVWLHPESHESPGFLCEAQVVWELKEE